jgi:RimJ/RimL family protein N-acetyltransferase
MLRGSRVALGPLRPEDSEPMFRWINDRELVQLNAPFKPVDRASHDEWFERIQRRDDVEIFAIRTVEGDRLVGSCQLNAIDREAGSCRLQVRIGEPEGRDRGYGTEAVRLLLRHAFDQLGLDRVELEVFATNRRAIRAYEKAGFGREGVEEGGAVIDGEPIDVVRMAASREGGAGGDGG